MDFVKATIESLQLPHWLIAGGALLVVVGLIGHLLSRRQLDEAEDDLEGAPIPEPRRQAPPLPDLLDSRSRKDRRTEPE
ncbi:hypothetical protein [Bradyrhizobium sp. 33ap4]|uniref:hypothetical protein n=1 Tax=Bradyrhizobium sp. 33ap4 TaxID=3061630 RepID=UPI00292D6233|nr:hypothetical protein [Bradyrhizobium sp. 33ap4]